MDRWYAAVVDRTERFLTWRKRRRVRKKEKQKKRNVIIEWLDAFIWVTLSMLVTASLSWEIPVACCPAAVLISAISLFTSSGNLIDNPIRKDHPGKP